MVHDQQQPEDKMFDDLCNKIASGSATPEEVQTAFQLLDKDIDSFSQNVDEQLSKYQQKDA